MGANMNRLVIIFLFFLFGVFACAKFPSRTESRSPKPVVLSESLEILKFNNIEGIVLPVSLAREVLIQCSRPTLGKAEAFWEPSVSDLIPLEEKLVSFVKKNASQVSPNQWEQLEKYKRQYAGIIRNGKKSIYVNLFPYMGERVEWRRQTVIVCDGGPSFFGVEYDIESKLFTHIAYNGVI